MMKKDTTDERKVSFISDDEFEAFLKSEHKDGNDDLLELDDNLALQVKSPFLELHKIFLKPEDVKCPKEYVDPPSECGICKKNLKTEKYFIEGRVTIAHDILPICESCFLEYGVGIGKDRGQLYAKHPEKNTWILISRQKM